MAETSSQQQPQQRHMEGDEEFVALEQRAPDARRRRGRKTSNDDTTLTAAAVTTAVEDCKTDSIPAAAAAAAAKDEVPPVTRSPPAGAAEVGVDAASSERSCSENEDVHGNGNGNDIGSCDGKASSKVTATATVFAAGTFTPPGQSRPGQPKAQGGSESLPPFFMPPRSPGARDAVLPKFAPGTYTPPPKGTEEENDASSSSQLQRSALSESGGGVGSHASSVGSCASAPAGEGSSGRSSPPAAAAATNCNEQQAGTQQRDSVDQGAAAGLSMEKPRDRELEEALAGSSAGGAASAASTPAPSTAVTPVKSARPGGRGVEVRASSQMEELALSPVQGTASTITLRSKSLNPARQEGASADRTTAASADDAAVATAFGAQGQFFIAGVEAARQSREVVHGIVVTTTPHSDIVSPGAKSFHALGWEAATSSPASKRAEYKSNLEEAAAILGSVTSSANNSAMASPAPATARGLSSTTHGGDGGGDGQRRRRSAAVPAELWEPLVRYCRSHSGSSGDAGVVARVVQAVRDYAVHGPRARGKFCDALLSVLEDVDVDDGHSAEIESAPAGSDDDDHDDHDDHGNISHSSSAADGGGSSLDNIVVDMSKVGNESSFALLPQQSSDGEVAAADGEDDDYYSNNDLSRPDSSGFSASGTRSTFTEASKSYYTGSSYSMVDDADHSSFAQTPGGLPRSRHEQVLALLSSDVQARSSDLEELKMTLLSLNSIVGELKAEKQSLQSEMEGKVAEVRATEKEVQAQRARLEALQAEAASLAAQTAAAVPAATMTNAAASAVSPSVDDGDSNGVEVVQDTTAAVGSSAEASDCDINAESAPARSSADEDAVAEAVNASLDDSLTMAVDLSADLSAAVAASGGSVDDPHVRQAFVWVAELEAEKGQLENEKDALEQEVAGLEARCQVLEQRQAVVDESIIAKAVEKALEQERERHSSAVADRVSEVETLKDAVTTARKRADAAVAAAEAKTVALVAAAESRAKQQIEEAQNELERIRRQLTPPPRQSSDKATDGSLTPEVETDGNVVAAPAVPKDQVVAWGGQSGKPKAVPAAAAAAAAAAAGARKNAARKQPATSERLKQLQAQLRKAREEAATERALHHVTKELLWAAKHGGIHAKVSRNNNNNNTNNNGDGGSSSDWLCAACDFKNFGSRGACFKCGSKHRAQEKQTGLVKLAAQAEGEVAGGAATDERSTASTERQSAAMKAAAEKVAAEKVVAEKAAAEKAAAEKAAAERVAAEKVAAEKAAAERVAAEKAAAEKVAAEKAAAEKAAAEKAAAEKVAAERVAAEKAAAEKVAAEKVAAEKAAAGKAAAEQATVFEAAVDESTTAKEGVNPEAGAVISGGEVPVACQVEAALSASQGSARVAGDKAGVQNAPVETGSKNFPKPSEPTSRSRSGSQGADVDVESMPPPSRPRRYRGRSRSRSRSRHQGRSKRVADFHPIGTAATAAATAAAMAAPRAQRAAESRSSANSSSSSSSSMGGHGLSSIVGRVQQVDLSTLVPLPEWLRVEGRVMTVVVGKNGTKEWQLNTATFIAGCFGLVLLLELVKALGL